MKYLPLIWSGIWRRPGRTVLMMLQIVSAFLLFGMLVGVSASMRQAIASSHGDRLYISSSVSVGDPLPVGLLSRIRSMPGIRAASPRAVFIGSYVRPDQSMPVIAADVEPFFQVYSELGVSPPGAVETLKNTRAGALIGSSLAQRYGWKPGDRFVLESPVLRRDGSSAWSFDVVGVYASPRSIGTPPSTAVITNFDYLNSGRAADADRVLGFVAVVRDAREAPAVSLAIDNDFANSDHETRTRTESDLLTTQLQRTVDLDFIVRAIVAAVFFALLLSVGALMMQSLRERGPELAVLKTLGFSGRRILALMLAESITSCVLAGVLGLAIAAALLPQASQLTAGAHMLPGVAATGLGWALLLALIAGAAPALRGSRMQVVDTLAGR
jgi:putative ABC transport system permease protein